MEATVCVGTYGDASWGRLARQRAIPSVEGPVVHIHADSLAQARNVALERVETEWVVFLDADDELEPGYLRAMSIGSADLRAPAVRYVQGTESTPPYVPRVVGHRHDCQADCLREGNFIAIGAAVRADLAREVGGFGEEPVYEDWALWLRCYLAGATVERLPEAVYRAHVREGSRNLPRISERRRVYREIASLVA